jgi:hypothetical protein
MRVARATYAVHVRGISSSPEPEALHELERYGEIIVRP